MNKVFLAISTQNQKDNIQELTSVCNFFDGLACVDHFSNDGTYELLNERKGKGFVVQIPYFGHHSHDLNTILFNPIIDESSWVLLRDSNERVNQKFASGIHNFVDFLQYNQVYSVYQYSKLLLFKRFPSQYFMGTPHWGFHGARPNAIKIEDMGWFKNDEEYCYSVRNINRDKYHFVWHYFSYYCNILDSNHALLGNEQNMERFQKEETIRQQFRLYLGQNNLLPITIDKFKWLCQNKLNEIKVWLNNSKVLNDAYRYYILEDKTFNDDHSDKNLIQI